jgi:hypothetical protein
MDEKDSEVTCRRCHTSLARQRPNARTQHPGAPQDSRGLIYALTFIMGIGVRCCAAHVLTGTAHGAQVLLPWNAFITASDYFGRVFMTVTTCARVPQRMQRRL